MAKKKEWYKDYATHAFIRYAAHGCPTRKEYEERIRQSIYKKFETHEPSFIVNKANEAVLSEEPLLKDFDAVNRVLEILRRQGKQHIIGAIKAVYFAYPKEDGRIEHGEIVDRVNRYAMECPASSKAVYAWLKSARLLCAQSRDLDTVEKREKW